MSFSPPKNFTPKKRVLSSATTPSQYSTPKNVRVVQNSFGTPECFTNVLLETPKASSKTNKEKYDEECNLRVAVRIRPMNATELAIVGSEDVVRVKDKQIIVCPPKYNHHSTSVDHTFTYDHVFWSVDEKSPVYSKQEDVFITIGVPLLNSAFRGFNACLFAYGQTGSGKSYSMMGRNICDTNDIDSEEFSGITPRFCKELFKRASELERECTISIDVSYFEIYNEKIQDLLAAPTQNSARVPLKVREHPILGPYIVDLTTHSVKSYTELRNFLILGNKNRAVASTSMNDFSSRSHSIFSIELGQSKSLDDTDSSSRSKVSLVDLAGSERLGSSYSNEERMKQGVYINKSLLTLGKCISALAEQGRKQFIPYRDSVLTWLLRESLGGNSLTSMLATISPSSTHLEETLSTLRYACQARTIVNRARINESPHDRLIRELRSEVERLRALRQDYERRGSYSQSVSFNDSNNSEVEDIKAKLTETESRLLEAQQMWEQRFMESRQSQLKELAKAEKYKAELESKVRILKTVNEDVSLSPYKTNFLEELEDVLTNEKENICESDLLENIKDWCSDNGLICTFNSETLKIVDTSKRKYLLLPIKIINAKWLENISEFLNKADWIENNSSKRLTKAEMVSSMNQIYEILENLQPLESDNNLNLLFAKLNKTLQKFETALLNSAKSNKTVTFNLENPN